RWPECSGASSTSITTWLSGCANTATSPRKVGQKHAGVDMARFLGVGVRELLPAPLLDADRLVRQRRIELQHCWPRRPRDADRRSVRVSGARERPEALHPRLGQLETARLVSSREFDLREQGRAEIAENEGEIERVRSAVDVIERRRLLVPVEAVVPDVGLLSQRLEHVVTARDEEN